MTTLALPDKTIPRPSPRHGVAGWLAFAASPTFVLMAWMATNGPAPTPLCSSGHDMPMRGMTAMYLLMSLFHLQPWLKLASGATHHSLTRGDRP